VFKKVEISRMTTALTDADNVATARVMTEVFAEDVAAHRPAIGAYPTVIHGSCASLLDLLPFSSSVYDLDDAKVRSLIRRATKNLGVCRVQVWLWFGPSKRVHNSEVVGVGYWTRRRWGVIFMDVH